MPKPICIGGNFEKTKEAFEREQLEEALLKMTELVNRDGGAPKKIFHPDFGWIDLKK